MTGSFKERGARYAIHRLKPIEREKGVIAARYKLILVNLYRKLSAGNHALALAYHGQQMDVCYENNKLYKISRFL